MIITFDAQGGTLNTLTKEGTLNSAYGELPIPIKTGYTFLGWYEQEPIFSGIYNNYEDIININADVWFYSQSNHSISFNLFFNKKNPTVGKIFSTKYFSVSIQENNLGKIYLCIIYKSRNAVTTLPISSDLTNLSNDWHSFQIKLLPDNDCRIETYIDNVQVYLHGASYSNYANTIEQEQQIISPFYFYLNSIFINSFSSNLIPPIPVNSNSIITNSNDHTLYACWQLNIFHIQASGNDAIINNKNSFDRYYGYNENYSLTVTPNPNYQFVKWTDNNLTNPRTTYALQNTNYNAICQLNSIYLGASQIKDLYIGTTPVKMVYIGDQKIYEKYQE